MKIAGNTSNYLRYSSIYSLLTKPYVMSTNKILMAGLVAAVVSFFLGWAIYGMLLMDFYATNVGTATGVMRTESEMVWWALIVGNLCTGLLFAYIYGRWASITSASTGAQAGAMIGLLIGGSWNLMMYGTSNLSNLTGTLVDIVVYTVMSAIVGAVAAWMLGRGN